MIINLSRIDFGGVATGGGTLVPLTVEASNENQTFEPSSYGADGFNSVNANGYDVDVIHNIIEDTYVGELGYDPTTLAEWDFGTANVKGSAYKSLYKMSSPITDLGVGNLEKINWGSNKEVTSITIFHMENISTYNGMFRNTKKLEFINADLGHKDGIDMAYMFRDSGITNIMNLGLETCKPTRLSNFAQDSGITQLPWMDTSNCTSFSDMLAGSCIITLPAYNYALCTASPTWASPARPSPSLITIEGVTDLGKNYSSSKTVSIKASVYPLLSKQSAWNIVNTVYDFIANNGAGNGSTLNFSGFNWEWDEGEQANLITTANAKGWNIAF